MMIALQMTLVSLLVTLPGRLLFIIIASKLIVFQYMVLGVIPLELQMHHVHHVFGPFLKVFSTRIVRPFQEIILEGSLRSHEILHHPDFTVDLTNNQDQAIDKSSIVLNSIQFI